MMSSTHLLREILLEGQARTQAEIKDAFGKRGVITSQSQISRLLHQIGAVKLVDHHGKTHYRLPHETGLIHELSSTQEKSLISQWVLSIAANEALVIVHTTPGAAGMVARVIDQHRMNLDTLGCIAGDDTIFIAPKNQHQTALVVSKITELFDM